MTLPRDHHGRTGLAMVAPLQSVSGQGHGISMRAYIWIGILIGSTIGGMIPSLWGDGMFSLWSILLSTAGGLLGLWAGVWIYG